MSLLSARSLTYERRILFRHEATLNKKLVLTSKTDRNVGKSSRRRDPVEASGIFFSI